MEALKYIFGPVPSRRLGRSLGINVVPSKICSMNCVYCEVGKTKALTLLRKPYIRAVNILNELSANYEKYNNIDVITVTGAGEPTLNSELDHILDGIKKISSKPVAILTNSTMFHDKNVFDTLLKFDIVVPSLDAVLQNSFEKVTLPHKDIIVENIIKNLEQFSNIFTGKLFLEILFCHGLNDSDEDIKSLGEKIKNIKADKIQVGSIVRPPAFSDAMPVSDEKILFITKYLRSLGLPCEATGSFKEVYKNVCDSTDLKALIISISKMRPCTVEDFSAVFGASTEKVKKILQELLDEGLMVTDSFENHIYYNHPSLHILKNNTIE